MKLRYELQRDPIYQDDELLREGGRVHVQVKITEIDENRVAVEFKKMSGSSFFFREQVDFLKDILSDYNDALMDEPTAEVQE